MYAAPFAMIIGSLLGFLIPSVSARDAFFISPATPANYDAAQQELEKIPEYLEASQCGGWDTNKSVEGTIATVQGVPGRNGVWDGNILSGMSTRKDENADGSIDNDFIFPDTTTGFTTACKANQSSIKKTVWRLKQNGLPNEIEQVDITYPHPQFADPSCRWRPKNGDAFSNSAPDVPLRPLNEYDPPPEYGELDTAPQDRQSPENCSNFCTMLNSYQYADCLETGLTTTSDTPPVEYAVCNRWGNRYICSDEEVRDANGACTSNQGDKANSIQCKGSECRCQEDAGPNPGNQCIENPGEKKEASPVYYSYYRLFEGSYARDAVTPEDNNDVASDTADAACYGFYHEFDPKTRQTETKDRRCVINFAVQERKNTQQEKGEYGQNTNVEDRDIGDTANQRTPKGQGRSPGDFDKNNDVWYLKFAGGFSLLNEKVFSGSYQKNLTNIFLNTDALDTAKIRATEQLDANTIYANGSYIRSFDDTGERNVVSWWQTEQSAIASLLHPPVIRLLLPSRWALGVDPSDPFFAKHPNVILKPIDKREDRIELQINAEDDTLGDVLLYLERSLLLHVIEEPIPTILPIGSSVEFRARAEAWCSWYMRKTNANNCDNAPEDVKRLIETLETYATDIQQYRLLRKELAVYAARVLDVQHSVTKPISEWLLQNITAYSEFLNQQKVLRNGYAIMWKQIQQKMNVFENTTNMPWCMNQRFTLPIYSLLDEWLPARSDAGKRIANGLPLITTNANADIVIDFSTISAQPMTVSLPVLQPVQVRVTDFPLPPSPEENVTIRDFPDLPSIEKIQTALRTASGSLPKPFEGSNNTVPVITFPTEDQETTQSNVIALATIMSTIENMNDRYSKFWQSIGPLSPEEGDDSDESKERKQLLECFAWDSATCQHVEMDLRERYMRIGSRPLVFLKEDYESKDTARSIGGPCVTESDVCSPIHPEEGGEKHIWEIIGTRQTESPIETLRTDVRNATLPTPIGTIAPDAFPRYGTETVNLLPSYDVPRAVELFQTSSSSSSRS